MDHLAETDPNQTQSDTLMSTNCSPPTPQT
jgi:hypothetical protein